MPATVSLALSSQIVWFEACREAISGPGIFCFSCPNAEELVTLITQTISAMPSGPSLRRRLSRHHQTR